MLSFLGFLIGDNGSSFVPNITSSSTIGFNSKSESSLIGFSSSVDGLVSSFASLSSSFMILFLISSIICLSCEVGAVDSCLISSGRDTFNSILYKIEIYKKIE